MVRAMKLIITNKSVASFKYFFKIWCIDLNEYRSIYFTQMCFRCICIFNTIFRISQVSTCIFKGHHYTCMHLPVNTDHSLVVQHKSSTGRVGRRRWWGQTWRQWGQLIGAARVFFSLWRGKSSKHQLLFVVQARQRYKHIAASCFYYSKGLAIRGNYSLPGFILLEA